MTITIPPEALEKAARALHDIWVKDWTVQWDDLEHCDQEQFRTEARAACYALIEHWPGMYIYPDTKICLPLTENQHDDKA